MGNRLDELTRQVFIEVMDELSVSGNTILDLPVHTINNMVKEAFKHGVECGLMDLDEEMIFKKLMGKKFIRTAERLSNFQRDHL